MSTDPYYRTGLSSSHRAFVSPSFPQHKHPTPSYPDKDQLQTISYVIRAINKNSELLIITPATMTLRGVRKLRERILDLDSPLMLALNIPY